MQFMGCECGQGDRGKPKKSKPMSPWMHQQMHSAVMAIPKPNAAENPLYKFKEAKKSTHGIACAALRTKISSRMQQLALPARGKPRMHYVTFEERELIEEMLADMTRKERESFFWKPNPKPYSGVKPAALLAKMTPRMEIISQAKLTNLAFNKRNFFFKYPKQQKAAILRHIQEKYDDFKENHPPEVDQTYAMVNGVIVHSTCTGKEVIEDEYEPEDPPPPPKPQYICQLTKPQRLKFRKRMKEISYPRKFPPPVRPDRGEKRPCKKFEKRLLVLARPNREYVKDTWDPFSVKRGALKYVISDRVEEIALPREFPPPAPFFDFEGNELPPRRTDWDLDALKRIVASPRTVEMSQPRFVKKKAGEADGEDPFAVPRRALTAWCSPRTKELAEPAKRE